MLLELNRADCSRIHIAMLEALNTSKGEPKTPKEASRLAYSESVAFYSDNPSPSLGDILDAAHAARSQIEIQTGGSETPVEFDIPSLAKATGFAKQESILVARLCGAMPFKTGGSVKWKNSVAIVKPFQFPEDMMEPC